MWEIVEGQLKCLHAFRHVICWVELLYRFSKRLDFDLNRRTLNSIHQTDFWRFQPGVHFNWINFPWSINPEIETIKKGGLWIITGSTHIFHETLMRTYWNKRLLVASELFEPQKKLFGFFKWNLLLWDENQIVAWCRMEVVSLSSIATSMHVGTIWKNSDEYSCRCTACSWYFIGTDFNHESFIFWPTFGITLLWP